MLSANEYQKQAARTIDKEMPLWKIVEHAKSGMVAELGEIHGMYQKRAQGHTYTEEHYKKEVGDLLWFIAEYCTARGWELEDIMQMNIDKLKARYPHGFESDKSLHRKEGDI